MDKDFDKYHGDSEDQATASESSNSRNERRRSRLNIDDRDRLRDVSIHTNDRKEQDIGTTVRELKIISNSIRYASVIMPDVLRIIQQYDYSEDLVGAIDELAYAIHDTTLAIRSVTRELKV